MMRIRSPRTVQQMQPLFISKTSSSASDDEVVVDAELAEFVDDHGVFLAVVLGEDAVEQRGLAGAEIAGEDGDGDGGGFGHGEGGLRKAGKGWGGIWGGWGHAAKGAGQRGPGNGVRSGRPGRKVARDVHQAVQDPQHLDPSVGCGPIDQQMRVVPADRQLARSGRPGCAERLPSGAGPARRLRITISIRPAQSASCGGPNCLRVKRRISRRSAWAGPVTAICHGSGLTPNEGCA